MKRVALYSRVSTKDQEPETQLRELREYASRRDWTIHAEFVDLGISGAKASRPQLDAMLADARRRRFDVCLVWRFDRFARSTTHLLTALEEFRQLGVDPEAATVLSHEATQSGWKLPQELGLVCFQSQTEPIAYSGPAIDFFTIGRRSVPLLDKPKSPPIHERVGTTWRERGSVLKLRYIGDHSYDSVKPKHTPMPSSL